MVRKLKYHEHKLLKKVDFISWKVDSNVRETQVLKRYRITKREDYGKYNKLIGLVKALAVKLKELDPMNSFRNNRTSQLLEKLYSMGLIASRKNLQLCEKLTVSALCRRLPVLMIKLRMAQTLGDAVKFIEQGHVRVGPHVVSDPAFLVSRNLEDFITWTDTSKIRAHILDYNEEAPLGMIPGQGILALFSIAMAVTTKLVTFQDTNILPTTCNSMPSMPYLNNYM